MTKPRYYVTTSIPYVNAKPHLGHALEFVQADILARYRRQMGDDVFFLTGTDDNSLKNVRAAEAQGVKTAEFVDRNAKVFEELTEALAISNDHFIRTASERHFTGVQKLWKACRPEDMYKKKYSGLYCVGCEAFYTEDELKDGKCPEHQTPPETVEEENYFFKLGNYQEKLEKLIESDEYRIIPNSRKNEVLSFIRMGLRDFSISRSKARARDWGVPVPGDDSQVVYVWYDALGNYVTGLGYDLDKAGKDPEIPYTRYWPAQAHVIGKGIIRFHAIYWPAMLLSAGLPVPKHLFVHGYINLGGAKMSKSAGTVIDPFDLVEKYGTEPVRYYLLRHVHPVQDSDFSIEHLEQTYTAGLANGIGNLLSRSLTMIAKSCGGEVRVKPCDSGDAAEIRTKLEGLAASYVGHMDAYEFSQALDKVWEGVASLDRYINDRQPWALAKDESKREELETVLYVLAEGLRLLSSLMYPAMPATSVEIWKRLGLGKRPLDVPWDEQARWGMLKDGMKVEKGKPLFPRLDPPKKS